MDVVSQVLNLQLCQHHERFCQFWMAFLEIGAHIQELTVSIQVSCVSLDETISGQDPFRCQRSGVSTTRDQISQSLSLQCSFDFVHEGQD